MSSTAASLRPLSTTPGSQQPLWALPPPSHAAEEAVAPPLRCPQDCAWIPRVLSSFLRLTSFSVCRPMPDIDTLMQEWSPEFEELLGKVRGPRGGVPAAACPTSLPVGGP